MDREKHLQWCKDKTLKYLETNDIQNAFASFNSDMSKHKETKDHIALSLGLQLMVGGYLSSHTEMKKLIEGFN